MDQADLCPLASLLVQLLRRALLVPLDLSNLSAHPLLDFLLVLLFQCSQCVLEFLRLLEYQEGPMDPTDLQVRSVRDCPRPQGYHGLHPAHLGPWIQCHLTDR